MSFRELRNFTEMMRGLGFDRPISMENFRKPNFKLVVEIIFWVIRRIDPKADIIQVLDSEEDRVKFFKSAGNFFFNELKVKLDLVKLYGCDGYFVREFIKVIEILYKAQKSTGESTALDNNTELDISARIQDINKVKALSAEIVDTGLNLFDLLEKEKTVKQSRAKALDFLDSLSLSSDSKKEQEHIEKSIIGKLQKQVMNLDEINSTIDQMEGQLKYLNEEIKIKELELESSEKKLELVRNVNPGQEREMKALEEQMQYVYQMYVEKVRNHDYLVNQIEIFNQLDKERNEKFRKELSNMNNNFKDADKNLMHDKNEFFNEEEEFGYEQRYEENLEPGEEEEEEFEEDEEAF